MTTIAYRDYIIAYDGLTTAGSLITDEDYDKKISIGNTHFFLAGTTGDFPEFVKSYLAEEEPERDLDVECFIWNGEVLKCSGVEDEEIFSYIIPLSSPFAIGSGQHFALTAMDMGATAKEAVKMAAKRDVGTGGRIRTFKIK